MNSPILYNDPSGHKACGDGEEYSCDGGKKQDPDEDPYKKDKEEKDKDYLDLDLYDLNSLGLSSSGFICGPACQLIVGLLVIGSIIWDMYQHPADTETIVLPPEPALDYLPSPTPSPTPLPPSTPNLNPDELWPGTVTPPSPTPSPTPSQTPTQRRVRDEDR